MHLNMEVKDSVDEEKDVNTLKKGEFNKAWYSVGFLIYNMIRSLTVHVSMLIHGASSGLAHSVFCW